ncbi:MAG: helix-hairpin-helix domain-containing protein [Micromonosporaceae bacterium]
MLTTSRDYPDLPAVHRLVRLFGAPGPDHAAPAATADRASEEAEAADRAPEEAEAGTMPAVAAGAGPPRPAVLETAAARFAPDRAPRPSAGDPEPPPAPVAEPTPTTTQPEPTATEPAAARPEATATEPTTQPEPTTTPEATVTDPGVVERLTGAFGVGRARLDPGTGGVRALGALAVLVVVVAAGIAWWSQPRPEPVAAPRVVTPTVGASAAATGVVVAVAGKVRRPGLVTLAPGARVADAIEAAGGVLPGTDVGYLNLARKVTDGELIVVGATPPPGGADRGGADPGTAPGDPGGKVNLNTATQQQLETLPGVGPVLATRILDYREKHGGFRSVDELRQVDGIGAARFEQLKDLVTV